VSPLAGSEIFAIPLAICLKHDGGFAFGEEARRAARAGLGRCEDHLLVRALRGEETVFGDNTYTLTRLLAMFLKKMVNLAGRLGPEAELSRLVVTIADLELPVIRTLRACVADMGLADWQKVHFMDHRESFFYYGSHLPPEFSSHDMGLFECRDETLSFWCLERGKRSRPQLLNIRQESYSFGEQQEDENFARIIPQAIGKQIVSTIYLVGDAFEGGWMDQSLKLLCQGRRVFLGKNLYSKGACYAAMQLDQTEPGTYVYMGEHQVKANVSLKVYERGRLSFHTLIRAGVPWYESGCDCDVMIDGTPTIDFWIQQPGSREARIEAVELSALPQRKNRTTRIAIHMEATSDHAVMLTLTDVGLGELVPGTGIKWEYELQL
jgi:hypothetical protein